MITCSFRRIYKILSGATTPGQSGPRKNRSLYIRWFNVIYRTLVASGVLPICRDVIGVFYSPSRLGYVLTVCKHFCRKWVIKNVFTQAPQKVGCDTSSNFKRNMYLPNPSTTIRVWHKVCLIQSFLLGRFPFQTLKSPNWPTMYPYLEGERLYLYPFQRELAMGEM